MRWGYSHSVAATRVDVGLTVTTLLMLALGLSCCEEKPAASPAPPATDAERARTLIIDGDPAQAKFVLYNRITGTEGTKEEYRLLLEACNTTNDAACAEECRKHLALP